MRRQFLAAFVLIVAAAPANAQSNFCGEVSTILQSMPDFAAIRGAADSDRSFQSLYLPSGADDCFIQSMRGGSYVFACYFEFEQEAGEALEALSAFTEGIKACDSGAIFSCSTESCEITGGSIPENASIELTLHSDNELQVNFWGP